MSDEIIRLNSDDFEEALDFLNLVFSQAHGSHDFERLIPRLYRKTERPMRWNFGIRSSGRIRAVVGLFPLSLTIGATTIRVAGIGGVSSHPRYRRRGLMSRLMSYCVGAAKDAGYHLSWLGGQRQRYQFFGYEKCGVEYSFRLGSENFKSFGSDEREMRFKEILPDDRKSLTTAMALHASQPMYCQRSGDDFYDSCTGWNSKPFIALDHDDRAIGYVVFDFEGKRISEILANTQDLVVPMVRSWISQHHRRPIRVLVHPANVWLTRALGEISEAVSCRSSGNWQIFDWVTVTDALLQVRRQVAPMSEGELVIAIEEMGSLRIRISADAAECIPTDSRADVRCAPKEAMRLLFGPLQPSQVIQLPPACSLLESWCPLPLGWSLPDAV